MEGKDIIKPIKINSGKMETPPFTNLPHPLSNLL
jgi:hypothetical protein